MAAILRRIEAAKALVQRSASAHIGAAKGQSLYAGEALDHFTLGSSRDRTVAEISPGG